MAAQLSAAHHVATTPWPLLSPIVSPPSPRMISVHVGGYSRASLPPSTPPPASSLLKSTVFPPSHAQQPVFSSDRLLLLAAALSPALLESQEAWAVEGQFGILEGRSVALIHPIVMGGLLVYTLWAGYLGWQWRRVRTVQEEINELKQQVTQMVEGAPPSPVEVKVKELTEERKQLVKGGYRDRHFNAGSILLAFGVLESVGGCVNTWFRTGKLFPGPHLFAGAGITVLWAFAAALVPAMQKGNETARSLHIALNTLNVVLFLSQVPTGLDIVYKVFEFTSWP